MRQAAISRLALRAARGIAAQAEAVQAGTDRPFSAAAGAAVNSKDGKVLHPDLLNENMRKTQYAVRGELYLKAEELKNKGKAIIFTNGGCSWRGSGEARACSGGPKTYHPRRCLHARSLLRCSHTNAVGNPHNLGAKPITFTRQVRRVRAC